MNNKIYEKNLEVLSVKQPDFLKQMEAVKQKIKEDYLVKVESQATRSGEDITVVHYNGKEYYLTGKYAPEKMAQKEANKIKHVKMFL